MPLLAPLLSIALGGRYTPLNLGPQRHKERTLAAVIDHIAGLATEQPVLVVFEDAHWIDPTSLELLSLTVERVTRLYLLLIITARPDFSPPWPTHRHVSVMALGRLGQREGAALAHRVAKGKALPAEVLNEIIEHTDGVPLFIEELTKTVLEGGLLREVDDRYVLTGPLPPLAIPSTLHASLLARLDRLASVKDIAQIGAAIGREFSFNLIGAVSGIPEQVLVAALTKLVAAELMFQRGVPPDATYRFKHALVQDAAYGTLLRGRRQDLHARVAAVLELRFADLVERQPELLAHHLTAAGNTERAVDQWLKAGQRAAARLAHLEAIRHFDHGLAALATLPEGPAWDQREIELHLARGLSLFTAAS